MISDSLTQSNELSNMINSFTFNLSGWVDYKNKKTDYNFIANYKNERVIGLEMFYNDNFYLISKDVFDKPLIGECDGCEDVFANYNSKDVTVILSSVKLAIKNSLKKEYFEKKKENITIDGKNYKALVSVLKLKGKDAKEISNNVLKELIDDENFVEATSKISGYSKIQIIEELKNAKKDLTTTSYNDQEMDVLLYTTGITNNFLKAEIKDSIVSMSITKTENKNEYVISINSNGIDVSFRMKYEAKENVKTSDPNVSDAVDPSTMTSDDANAIIEKIMDSEGIKLFNNDFKLLTGYTIEELFESFGSTNQDSMQHNY